MNAARVDANHADIVATLRRIGCLVQDLSAVGKGVPDLLICCPNGRLVLLEVKDGTKPPSARELTPQQRAWHLSWRRAPLHVVTSAREALVACGVSIREFAPRNHPSG